MDQLDKNDELLKTPASREVQQSAKEVLGVPFEAHAPKPNGKTFESPQPVAKPNGSAGSTETQHIGGGIFDPARWKTPIDARLDPKAPIKTAAFSKVEVRKPPPDHYVHAHPDPAFNGVFPLYADSLAKRYEPYLIAPELVDSLPPQAKVNVKHVRLAVALTDTGRLFLWFIPQTGSEWHESGDSAILTAMTQWVKVVSDGSGYRQDPPEVQQPEPVFPDVPFAEYLMRAFKDRYIDSLDHPVIKRLAGIR